MSQVLIDCPETGEPVYIGLNFNWFTFEALELGDRSFECPVCGRVHAWTNDDAYLRSDGGEC